MANSLRWSQAAAFSSLSSLIDAPQFRFRPDQRPSDRQDEHTDNNFQRGTDREVTVVEIVQPHNLKPDENQNDGQPVLQQVESVPTRQTEKVERLPFKFFWRKLPPTCRCRTSAPLSRCEADPDVPLRVVAP